MKKSLLFLLLASFSLLVVGIQTDGSGSDGEDCLFLVAEGEGSSSSNPTNYSVLATSEDSDVDTPYALQNCPVDTTGTPSRVRFVQRVEVPVEKIVEVIREVERRVEVDPDTVWLPPLTPKNLVRYSLVAGASAGLMYLWMRKNSGD